MEREEEEEARRRQAQSQRDKARNRREDEERITRIARAVQRQLALDCQPSQPAAVPIAQSSTTSLVVIMEARSVKLMQDIARYSPFRLAPLYLTFIGCLTTQNTPMPRSSSTKENYLFTSPLSVRKANTSTRHSRARLLKEVQEYSHSMMIVEPPIGGRLNICTLVTNQTICRLSSRVWWKSNLFPRFSNGCQMIPRC